MKWFFSSPLYDRDPGAAGGAAVIDPGAAHEIDDDPPPKGADPPPAKGKDAGKGADGEEDDLRAELERLRQENKQAKEDARYWAGRAQRVSGRGRESGDEPDGDDPARETRRGRSADDDKPEKLLEDLTLRGAEALRERGFISQAELDRRIKETREETRREINVTRADAEFGMRIENEFPEIAADVALISKGGSPKSELFQRASEIYRESVAMDPQLEGSKSALLIACRQAKAELKGGGGRERDDPPPSRDRQQARRERIERQQPVRGRERGEEADDADDFTEDQRTVMAALKIKPEEWTKHKEVRRGR